MESEWHKDAIRSIISVLSDEQKKILQKKLEQSFHSELRWLAHEIEEKKI
jgi:hypothetical protein